MTLLAISTLPILSDINETVETYGSENVRMTFIYDGKYREVQPFKLDDSGNLSSVVTNEPGTPFKKFSMWRMENVRTVITAEVPDTDEDPAPVEDNMTELHIKLNAIKVLRPQHTAAVEALESIADQVDEMYMNAQWSRNPEIAKSMGEAANALRKSIAASVVKLSV